MKCLCRGALASALVLVLLTSLCLGCAGDDEPVHTITVGQITDVTGPASSSLVWLHYVIEDLVRYYNEQGLIPGAKIRLDTYDARYDPARDVPGYEWCREHGADVILAHISTTAEVLKGFAQRDKVVVVTPSVTSALVEPPGWVFTLGAPFRGQIMTMLEWISENHWDYAAQGRLPKVGFAAWRMPAALDGEKAAKDYQKAHPDKFEWGGSGLPPVGSMSFSSEAEVLKDCDYIILMTNTAPHFIRDYLAKGYKATFVSDSAAGSYRGFYAKMVGWENLDGFLSTEICRQYPEECPTIALALQFLNEWHPDEVETILGAGTAYCGGLANFHAFFQLLKKAVEEVGAENFDGQAFYNAALDFELQFEGHPKWWYSESDRVFMHHAAIYEWSANTESEVRASDWLPLVYE